MRVLISGGGTGGHIYPAIAIADEIKERNPDAYIHFVGAQGRMEMEKIPKAGYTIEGLWISGLQRRLTRQNILFPIKLISSLWNARKIIKRVNPQIVIGVGGYASGPTLYMASILGIPTLIQEQNSYPGITNRLLAKRVNKICVAYENMDRFFDRSKLVYTGNPIRKNLIQIDDYSTQSYNYFDLDQNKKTLLLFGGSLGARSLNEAIRDSFEAIAKQSDLNVIWQVGSSYFEEFKTCSVAQLDHVKVLPFIDRMDMAYQIADLAVTRAGALTISELSLVGQAAILIPSPNVAEDHQTMNAKSLVDYNAAIMIADNNIKEKLISEVMKLMKDESRLADYAVAIKKRAKPYATQHIVDEVMKIKKA